MSNIIYQSSFVLTVDNQRYRVTQTIERLQDLPDLIDFPPEPDSTSISTLEVLSSTETNSTWSRPASGTTDENSFDA